MFVCYGHTYIKILHKKAIFIQLKITIYVTYLVIKHIYFTIKYLIHIDKAQTNILLKNKLFFYSLKPVKIMQRYEKLEVRFNSHINFINQILRKLLLI